MPEVDKNNQSDQSERVLKKADNPTPPHEVADNIRKKPVAVSGQRLK